jgi:hypothetical protein
LKESSLRGVTYFVALAILAGRDVRCDGLALPGPEVLSLDSFISPGNAWMRSIGWLMMLSQDQLLQTFVVRNAESSLVVVQVLTLLHLGTILG